MYEDNYEELTEAEEEWNLVPSIIPNALDTVVQEEGETNHSNLTEFNEAWDYFQVKDMTEYLRKAKPTLEWSRISSFARCISGPPNLRQDLVEERNMIFAIASCPLLMTEDVHKNTLQTIYKRLRNYKFNVPLVGKHWEEIGFQGSDPATDLRGVGFWGLMNLLYMLMCPETFQLACNIYKLSQDEIQAIVNEVYVAAFRWLFVRWKSELKTISHSGFILKEVESYARKHPKRLLQELEAYLRVENKRESTNITVNKKAGKYVQFSLIGE